MGADWGSPITMGSEPSSDSDDMEASAPASPVLGASMASEKRCPQCGQTKRIDDFTAAGKNGRGWCEECRNKHAASTQAKRKAAKQAENEEAVSSTRPIKAAKSKRSIPQFFEDAYGTKRKAVGGMASNDGPSEPPKRNTYTFQKRQCCGLPHHWRQKCPTAPPATMREEPEQCRTAEPGKDYPDHNPDRVIDWGMPGAWADRSPQRRVRQKKVASFPSSQTPAATHETTQRSWAPSTGADGLRGLREVVKETDSGEGFRLKLLHHRQRNVGIQCKIPPEYIIPTDNDDFVVSSFVPTGRTVTAVPRDINWKQ